MAKPTLVLALLVAWVCLTSSEEAAKEETTLNRQKRQGFGQPGFSFNQGGFQGNVPNPFGGGNFAFNVPGLFGARPQQPQQPQQHQSFTHNRPQTFPTGNTGGFQPGGGNRPGGNRPGGGRPDNFCRRRRNRNRPECQNQNQGQSPGQIDCTKRRFRSRPECQQTPPPTSSISDLFSQIPWLNQISQDGRRVRIPGLPETPAAVSRSGSFLLGSGRPDDPFQDCLTPRFEPGNCRFLHHCVLPEIVGNFNNFLRYVCFIESRYVGVCCPRSFNNNGAVTTTPRPTTPRPTPRPTTPPSESRGCGLIAKRPPTRIVGGKPADPQEWPWMAALLRDGSQQYCGGVLITDQAVLTAAHCIHGFSQSSITVRLGEYTFNRQDDSGHVDFSVRTIRMHEQYDTNTYVNDIAILILDRPTSFNADIWPVCLPEGDNSYENEVATVTGWGTIHYTGNVATTLQEVTVPVWKNSDCDASYTNNDIIDKQLCAGGKEGGKDSCQGDSGGPLLLRQGGANRWAVIGVVSWGIRCGEKEFPGVYTRVTKYLSWITSNARP